MTSVQDSPATSHPAPVSPDIVLIPTVEVLADPGTYFPEFVRVWTDVMVTCQQATEDDNDS